MSNMQTRYQEEMSGVTLSPARRDQMAQAIASVALSSRAKGHEGRVVKLGHACRRLRLAAAVVAAGIAIVVGAGGYAYANGQLVSVASTIDDVFFGATAPTNVQDKVGRPVAASITSDGITISADAIIGDERNYVVIYSIRRTDGEALGKVGTDSRGTLTLDGRYPTADFNQSVDGARGQGGGVYFYDADPSDNAIQMVTQMTTDINVIGATTRASFTGISTSDSSFGSTTTIATGNWSLKFKLNYQSDAIALSPAGTFVLAGTSGSVQRVSVSPVGVSIDYTVNGTEQAPASGRWSPAYLDLGTITINMKDDTSFSIPCGAGSSQEADGRTICQTGSFFDRIIDPSQVASVSFDGVTATA